MRFEFDLDKSATNRRKHGIDFWRAKRLWDDDNHLEIPARSEIEERTLVIAALEGHHWTAVVTQRHGTIRIISVRRARKEEVAHYEGR